MADVFGDLSLFSEFEKEREADGSFIRYDESSLHSRIIFEGFASDEESDSDIEQDDHVQESSDLIEKGTESSTSSKQSDNSNETKSKEASSNDKATRLKTEKDLSWLNDQLYADAEEKAKGPNINLNQLMFEKIKYERFCKMIDSTRFVPDEESPPVQILFHNTSFARKYRQQIEQFIKSLLWEFVNSGKSEAGSPEITVKPGTPSCVDINTKLTPEQKYETMRQNHALLGSCQFHNKFLVDFLGWPFTVGEPQRCNENWEVPLYSQVFNEVYADPSNKGKSQERKKTKPACWNCGTENHAVAECRRPRNPARIAAKRKEFLEQQQDRPPPKFTGAKRYHLDPEISSKYAKFQAGHMSDSLREALGLRTDQLPQHIYKMRLFGYPPGWLAEAKPAQSNVTVFDKNGAVTLGMGDTLEDGELNDGSSKEQSMEYDLNRIVEFPGFTVPVPLGIVDEHETFKMPPIQEHQLKRTLMKQSKEKKVAKKRKRGSEQDEKKAKEAAKRSKVSTEDGEDGEIQDSDETGENGDTQPTEEDEEEEEASGTTQASDDTPSAAPDMNRSSSTVSLSLDYGTPILVREKSDLPDATKFGVGIEDHIPFENLPDSVGMFAKMKDLIDMIRKKKTDSS